MSTVAEVGMHCTALHLRVIFRQTGPEICALALVFTSAAVHNLMEVPNAAALRY